eukprot:g733.t1
MSSAPATSSSGSTSVRKDGTKANKKADRAATAEPKLETGLVFEDVDMAKSLVEDAIAGENGEEDDGAMGDEDDDDSPKVKFPAIAADQAISTKGNLLKQIRRIMVPANRFSPLRNNWADILKPLVDHMKLQVRMNAFMMGFDVQDAIALLRLDDLFISSFQVKDVKRLQGDHMSRCIGRIAGKNGQTKYAIENATRTRVVVADSHIHILGSFTNIKFARDAICSLILGAAPSKVYQHLRSVTKRVQERL